MDRAIKSYMPAHFSMLFYFLQTGLLMEHFIFILFHEAHLILLFLHWSNRWQYKYRSLALIISSFIFFNPLFWTRFIFIIHRKHVLYGMPYLLTYSNMHARMNITSLDWFIIMQSYSNEALSIIVTSAVELELAS